MYTYSIKIDFKCTTKTKFNSTFILTQLKCIKLLTSYYMTYQSIKHILNDMKNHLNRFNGFLICFNLVLIFYMIIMHLQAVSYISFYL